MWWRTVWSIGDSAAYAEAATGNRHFFLGKPQSIG
jgi:hypothetical protein